MIIMGLQKMIFSFSDEILKHIVENYTNGEEGVRNLKRCLETVISKINIYMLAYDQADEGSVKDLSFKIKGFEMLFHVNRDHTGHYSSIIKSIKPQCICIFK